jgi:hypothetical protein
LHQWHDLLSPMIRCYRWTSGKLHSLRQPQDSRRETNSRIQHDLSDYEMPTPIPNLPTPPSLKQAINSLAEGEAPRESHEFLHELRSCWDTVGANYIVHDRSLLEVGSIPDVQQLAKDWIASI